MALEWIERHCIIPDGFRKGGPFRPYDYQALYLANYYRVRGNVEWTPAAPVLAPAYVHRRGLLVGPQKLGKNPLIASQVCLEGAGPALFAGYAGPDEGYVCREHGCRCGWEYPYDVDEPRGMRWPTPLIQITAFSQDSTDNTYDALRPMIELGPLADIIPKTGEEFIRLPGGGRIDTVTSSNQSRLGQRVTFVPQDELGLWTATNKMIKLAETQYRNLSGMGGRASLTSNAWDPAEQSVAQREYESAATDIYRQFVQPPKNLSYGNKAERHKIHQAVYPRDVRREHGGHLDLDSIEAEAADLYAKDPAQAQRFYGNILVAGAGKAVDPDVWDALALKAAQQGRAGPPPANTPVGLGFDGAESHDAIALRGCTADGYAFTVGIWERPKDAGADYRHPRTEVIAAVHAAFARYNVGLMLCDPPWWATEIEEWARRYGDDVVLAFDTLQARRMAPAVDRWRTAIRTADHIHDGDPVAARHVKAAALRRVHVNLDDGDERTKYVLEKGDNRAWIDAAVADVLALEAAQTMEIKTTRKGGWAFIA